jgi:hypothetical protein
MVDRDELTVRKGVPRAVAARYNRMHRYIDVTFESGMMLRVPVAMIEGLAGARARTPRVIEIKDHGRSLYWPDLDLSLALPGLPRAWVASRSTIRR